MSTRSFLARGAALLGLLALLATPVGLVAQAPPPDGEWLTFTTSHFRITFPPDLEGLARRAADAAERTHAILRDELARPPEGLIELVLTDHVDLTNGYATPFPSNRIVVYARPPLDMPQLAYARDWIELVVAHELVHVFHLDQAGGVGRALRGVFGRVPMFWPLFPAVGTPGWNIEGLATHYESRLTGAGRVHGSFHDMVVRTAALEDEIPDLDAVSTPSPVWPGGQRSYVYGASFMRWLAEEYGPDVHGRLLDATASATLPTFLFFGEVAEAVTEREFASLYQEWRSEARDRALALRDQLAGATVPGAPAGTPDTLAGTLGTPAGTPDTLAGTPASPPGAAPASPARSITVAEPVIAAGAAPGGVPGPFAVAPRVSPDGSRLAYAEDDYRSAPTTTLLDLTTGAARTLADRNQAGLLLGPASWLPDGSGLITAQLQFDGPYRLHSDLWRLALDGEQSRLTHGARLTQPDVAGDGRIVAVQNDVGALRLVVHHPARGLTRVLADAPAGGGFAAPRWSPDGRTVAAARFLDGRMDLVLVDVASGAVTTLTDDDALDLAPAWTTDGAWVLFSSDRTGIPNLFAAAATPDSGGVSVRQVTSVLGGAFDPDVSPDGRWIYFSGYHADGWRIERIPLDPERWWAAPSSSLAYGDALLAPPGVADTLGTAPSPIATSPVSRYSAWPSVRPHFWIPTYETASAAPDRLRFVGAYAMGQDVLQRHTWAAALAVDPGAGRLLGDLTWTWRGLGVPQLTLSLERDWSRGGSVPLPGSGGEREGVWLREERASLDALFIRQRWRSAAWLTAGAELRGRGYDLHRGGDDGDAILDQLGVPSLPTLVSAQAGIGWRNAVAYPYSIGLQDGAAVSLGLRRWWDLEGFSPSYDQAQGRAAAYLGFRGWGFADHVLAGRLSALARVGDGALPTSIGGAGGSPETLVAGATFGGSALFLPVRGYDDGDRVGTRAWSASAEYRFPLHLAGWNGDILGLSVTALSGTLFADAGDAWCATDDPGQPGEPTTFGCATGPGDPLLSAGAELSLDFGVLHTVPLRLRGGVAVPFTDVDPDDGRSAADPRNWRFHLVFGPSF